jgi:hypothetical protein
VDGAEVVVHEGGEVRLVRPVDEGGGVRGLGEGFGEASELGAEDEEAAGSGLRGDEVLVAADRGGEGEGEGALCVLRAAGGEL